MLKSQGFFKILLLFVAIFCICLPSATTMAGTDSAAVCAQKKTALNDKIIKSMRLYGQLVTQNTSDFMSAKATINDNTLVSAATFFHRVYRDMVVTFLLSPALFAEVGVTYLPLMTLSLEAGGNLAAFIGERGIDTLCGESACPNLDSYYANFILNYTVIGEITAIAYNNSRVWESRSLFYQSLESNNKLAESTPVEFLNSSNPYSSVRILLDSFSLKTVEEVDNVTGAIGDLDKLLDVFSAMRWEAYHSSGFQSQLNSISQDTERGRRYRESIEAGLAKTDFSAKLYFYAAARDYLNSMRGKVSGLTCD